MKLPYLKGYFFFPLPAQPGHPAQTLFLPELCLFQSCPMAGSLLGSHVVLSS